MKTLIVALNSKYIHSSLAPWYLKEACGSEKGEVKTLEFTINDSMEAVLAAIYSEKADVAAFSCYIWNIFFVLRLVRDLKKVCPGIITILGGPEVSYDGKTLMEKEPAVDYVLAGEGEESFSKLLEHIQTGMPGLTGIKGLFYRIGRGISTNEGFPIIENLDTVPSPYTDEMLASLGDRIVYFEASRGCPFGCTYCLSSTTKGVRHFSTNRVKRDLDRLIKAGVKQVKFVDRTFNCSRTRAKEIFEYIIEKAPRTNFHFEAAADLFDDEMLDILSKAPHGIIQFEIGIQTTNPRTLAAIERKSDLEQALGNIRRLKEPGNIHIHLDLIAGLPFEDYDSFMRSFDDVYRLKPHALQLGFLKLLKGSKIRAESDIHGYRYRDYPPYEILSSKYISYEELLVLKGIEELVDRFYNSGRFVSSLEYVISTFFRSPFDFYREFYLYNKHHGYLKNPVPSRELYTVFLEFGGSFMENNELELFGDLMKLDFLSSDNSNNLPAGLSRDIEPRFKGRCFDFLKDEENTRNYLPEFSGIPAKQVYKQVHFEAFKHDVLEQGKDGEYIGLESVVLFDYNVRDRVTGLYRRVRVEI